MNIVITKHCFLCNISYDIDTDSSQFVTLLPCRCVSHKICHYEYSMKLDTKDSLWQWRCPICFKDIVSSGK